MERESLAEGGGGMELDQLRRRSGISLDADGSWRYRGADVAHPRVQALFHRGVAVRGDGEVTLAVGRMWCYVQCETVARFVDGLRVQGDALVVRYRGGATETVTEPSLAAAPDGRFYLWAAPAGPPAGLGRVAASQVAGWVDEEDGQPVLRVGRRAVPIATLAAVPGPADAAPD
jgi:hypothetical protein